MQSARAAERRQVEIVGWANCDDSALCCLVRIEGTVFAAVNVRYGTKAVSHIRYHVARGFTGRLVCPRDCPEVD